MSCHIVGDKIINRVIGRFLDERNSSYVWRQLTELGFSTMEPEKLGQAMYDLNFKSCTGRYDEEMPQSMAGDEPYKYGYEFSGKMQAFKSLHYYLYQSCEGECDRDPLYIALDKYFHQLAIELIEETDGYKSAEWG